MSVSVWLRERVSVCMYLREREAEERGVCSRPRS